MRALLLALMLVLVVRPAGAAEYRLLVASMQEEGFFAYMPLSVGRGEGEATLPRLEERLDTGRFPAAVLLYDRLAGPSPAGLARAFAGVPVRPVTVNGGDRGQWQELRWEGQPGERTVWVIAPAAISFQEVRHVALGGRGPARYYIPYSVAPSQSPSPAILMPLAFIGGREGDASLWDSVGGLLDLSGGVGVVVGSSADPTRADHVVLVVQNPPQGETLKVVVGWRRRPTADDRIQSPGVEK